MAKTTRNTSWRHFVGLDVSKHTLDCWVRPAAQAAQWPNTPEGFDALHAWLQACGCHRVQTVLCLENTGPYDDQLLATMTRRGWACVVEKTTILSRIGPEHHRKTDAFDARQLAEYADRFADTLQVWTPPAKEIAQLRHLTTERRRLVTQRAATQAKQTQAQQQTQVPALLPACWQAQITFLTQQITQIETRIRHLIHAQPRWAQRVHVLTSIPGIGEVTAWRWLGMFAGQSHLSGKQLASRFGVAPHPRQSGTSVRGPRRSAGHGQAEVRKLLCLCARSASTHCARFRQYKERKLAEGKPAAVVRNNIMNKLIHLLCAVWNTGHMYDPDHVSRFHQQAQDA